MDFLKHVGEKEEEKTVSNREKMRGGGREDSGRIASLDGLKGILALMVCVHHYGNVCIDYGYQFPDIIPESIYVYGYLSVEFFFMLSGFLMALNHCENRNDENFITYIKNRMRNIYPPYVFAFLLLAILLVGRHIYSYITGIVLTDQHYDVWHIILTLTLTSTGWIENTFNPYVGNGWFICVLFLCYISFYFARIVRQKNIALFQGICVILAMLGHIGINQSSYLPFLNFSAGRGILSFWGGVLLYEIYTTLSQRKISIITYINFFVVLVIMLLGRTFGFDKVMGDPQKVCMFYVFPIILLAALQIRWCKGILSSIPFWALGKISFAIYLVHPIIWSFIYDIEKITENHYDLSDSGILMLGIIIVLIVSIVWHILIEKRFTYWFGNICNIEGK